ncbi:MAG: endonuclease/exonuclease/phosphatase family protein [Rhodospirillaceae bacterium]|nr:endonuclease/exonuclease/phosphatase family protein [Rhodospirillaceae bacterium]
MIRRVLSRKSLYRIVPEDDSVRVLGQATRKSLGQHFTIVCWNIYKARRHGWLEDLTALTADADFVLLQEAMLHGDKAHPFHVASGFEWVMAQNFAYRSAAVTSGVKTGSRIAAINRKVLRSPDKEPIIALPKTILATEYDILNTAGNLLVLNIHAINITSSRKFGRQVAQLEAVLDDHKGPVILAGDFNTWNPKRRRILFDAVETHALHHVPIGAPQWRHLGQVLDHVFYRGMTLKSATCMQTIRSSDHVPLKVEFEQLAQV